MYASLIIRKPQVSIQHKDTIKILKAELSIKVHSILVSYFINMIQTILNGNGYIFLYMVSIVFTWKDQLILSLISINLVMYQDFKILAILAKPEPNLILSKLWLWGFFLSFSTFEMSFLWPKKYGWTHDHDYDLIH